jgi:hypothetical protein
LVHIDESEFGPDLPTSLGKAAVESDRFDLVFMAEAQGNRAYFDTKVVDFVSQFYMRWVSCVGIN